MTRLIGFSSAAAVTLIDFGTKAAARAALVVGPLQLLPVLDRLSFNSGVSFSLFSGGARPCAGS